MLEGLIGVGIALLLGVALAEYAKMRSRAEKGFSVLAVAGVILLFAGVCGAATNLAGYVGTSWSLVVALFEVIGWVLSLVGTVYVAYEALIEK